MGEDTKRVYTFIKTFIDHSGYAPTKQEIARELGLSVDKVTTHISLLVTHGLIEQTANKLRGLKVRTDIDSDRMFRFFR
jgi:SOS-response transcriptional repressor LexA